MAVDSVILIGAVECKPEAEQGFNTWVEEVHYPMLLKFKGLTRITRYQMLKADDEKKYPQYINILEFKNQQAFEAYEASPLFAEAQKDVRRVQASFGLERKWRVIYKAVKSRSK